MSASYRSIRGDSDDHNFVCQYLSILNCFQFIYAWPLVYALKLNSCKNVTATSIRTISAVTRKTICITCFQTTKYSLDHVVYFWSAQFSQFLVLVLNERITNHKLQVYIEDMKISVIAEFSQNAPVC